jgi:hypothetical protein
MQLLDSLQNQLTDSSCDQMLNALQDIASNIQITSDYSIIHPDYKPLEFLPEVLANFEQLPLEIRKKYLSLQLRNFLYGIYFNGSIKPLRTLEENTVNLPIQEKLENNSAKGLNLEFYEQLHQSNCGKGYFDPGWLVLREENDGSLAVQKNGLTLHIDRDQHLTPLEKAANVGDLVAILKPRNTLENEFYVAIGNQGEANSETVEIYLNLTPEGAVVIMGTCTGKLNKINIPFTLKVLHNPSDYDRYYTGILSLKKSDYEAVKQWLQTVYQENQLYFRPEVPLFTKLLAPGLSLAEQTNPKLAATESFGLHHCRIIANSLLSAWQNGDHSKESKMASIYSHLSQDSSNNC